MQCEVKIRPAAGEGIEAAGILGISIMETQPGQRHVGLLIRPEKMQGALMHVHMGWDGADHFFCEPPPTKAYWIDFESVDEVAQANIADIVHTIFQSNSETGLPYSVMLREGHSFNLTNHKVEVEFGEGFTCASFVLASLAAAQLELVNRASWPYREEDEKWQRLMIGHYLARTNKPLAEAQRDQIGKAARFRPEEVAAAVSCFEDAPVEFDRVLPLSLIVLRLIGASAVSAE